MESCLIGEKCETIDDFEYCSRFGSMKTILPLKTMTRLEKIQAMEEIWQDLTHSKDHFEPPSWHESELQERANRVKEGKESYIPWEQAKRMLREKK